MTSSTPTTNRNHSRITICLALSAAALCLQAHIQRSLLSSSPSAQRDFGFVVEGREEQTKRQVRMIKVNDQARTSKLSDASGDGKSDGSALAEEDVSNGSKFRSKKSRGVDAKRHPDIEKTVATKKISATEDEKENALERPSAIVEVHSNEGKSSIAVERPAAGKNSHRSAHVENAAAVQIPRIKSSCKPLPPLKWEFQHYTETDHHPSKRLLIGMYSGFDKYARMLDVTSAVNKAYAKRWGHSTVVLQGVAMHLGELDGGYNCTPKAGVRAAFNKIKLLQYALNHTDQFDQLLLVDTDAMMYDFDFDVTSLIDDDSVMLVAHRVRKEEPERGNWNVNNGVTLWNLHHAETAGVAEDWDYLARKNLAKRNGLGGDQHKMHWAIREGRDPSKSQARISGVRGNYDEFMYGHGSVVRHYIRDSTDWNAPNPLENRIAHLDRAAKQVCDRYSPDVCGSIDRVSYEAKDEVVSAWQS